MIKVYGGTIMTVTPPKFIWDWWCGGCDRVEVGDRYPSMPMKEFYKEMWDDFNKADGLA